MEIFRVIVEVLRVCWAWIYLLSPVKVAVIEQGEVGVRFTFGIPGPNLDPGIRWATSFQRLDHTHATLRKNPIEEIRTHLQDCIPVTVNGVVAYSVTDYGRFLTASEDTDWMIGEFAESAVKEQLGNVSFAGYHGDRKELEKKVSREIQQQCTHAQFGVKIRYFRITSFEITLQAVQNALVVDLMLEAMDKMPEGLDSAARVALLVGAMPVNSLSAKPEDYEYDEADEAE